MFLCNLVWPITQTKHSSVADKSKVMLMILLKPWCCTCGRWRAFWPLICNLTSCLLALQGSLLFTDTAESFFYFPPSAILFLLVFTNPFSHVSVFDFLAVPVIIFDQYIIFQLLVVYLWWTGDLSRAYPVSHPMAAGHTVDTRPPETLEGQSVICGSLDQIFNLLELLKESQEFWLSSSDVFCGVGNNLSLCPCETFCLGARGWQIRSCVCHIKVGLISHYCVVFCRATLCLPVQYVVLQDRISRHLMERGTGLGASGSHEVIHSHMWTKTRISSSKLKARIFNMDSRDYFVQIGGQSLAQVERINILFTCTWRMAKTLLQ